MIWFFNDPERLILERKGIEALSNSAKWLIGTDWLFDGGLCLDAIIRAHGHDYEVRVSFPALYPDTPAVVYPRKMQSRISPHQYGGADGPLCLEWGPDNWHRDVTAVQVLESAHRLFETENPLGKDRPKAPVVANSRHRLTIGQELRGEWARWYSSRALASYLAEQPENSIGSFKFSYRNTGENYVFFIHEAIQIGGSVWKDCQIPTNIPGAEAISLSVGVWFKTDLDEETIRQPRKVAELQTLLADMDGTKFIATDGTSPIDGFRPTMAGVLIMDRKGGLFLFIVFGDESVMLCKRVQSETAPVQSRSPDASELNTKTIGIVGMGSVGSKIALSLARMGVRNFYLIDHDILLPENFQRHALDWQGAIQHKVDAMKFAIDMVVPGANVEVSRLHITGQESNASVSGALNRLAACDLIIEATASPRVFNLLAAVTRASNLPMIWMEVYGGGIGGLVARSRPGIDPAPHDMRGAYLRFCEDNPDFSLRVAAESYAVENEDGEVLAASDADTAIIAHHAARFVSDCFIPPDQAKFPYSMYLIGLTSGWVFEAPFATIPISMDSFPVKGGSEAKNNDISPENVEFLSGLLQKQINETNTTSGN
jgi:sulfur-carrier protein adenylyltransferase/sulfurtransferase